jgi:membrane-bound inhibitor of C-type lysozyme
MRIRHMTATALALAVAGCTTTATKPQQAVGGDPMPWTTYACSDGQSVQAAYPDTNTALVKINGQTHTLHVAISASGARYTGDRWQWWTKGMHDGMLAPLAPGESIASAPGVTCHAG